MSANLEELESLPESKESSCEDEARKFITRYFGAWHATVQNSAVKELTRLFEEAAKR